MGVKKIRREEEDWPSAEEIDKELLERLFKGKSPFEKWNPSKDMDQAMRVGQDVAWKRGWNFEVGWISYAGRTVLDEWEAFLKNFTLEAAQRGDYSNVVENYWATAKTAQLAICRMLLNMLDGVRENDYMVEQ